MFKSLQSNNSIPNNYVYTSNRGTEYMYLEGSWVNCDSMKIVENAHTFKMNQSAMRQIAEHNEKSSLQIGKSYVINESEYTYVGRNNFSLQGNLLSESMNTRVHRLVEADEEQHKPGQKNDQIPNYFQTSYGRNNDRYYYKDGWWINKDSEHQQAVHNPRLNTEITNDALDIIHQHNNDPKAAMPIGTQIEHNGKTLTYIGDAFVTDEGRRTNSEFTDRMEKKAKEDKSAQGSGQGEPAAEGEPQGQDTAPEATPDSQGASDAPEQDSGSTESSSGEVPNGYVYKSKKGNSYFKKNGQWFNSATKQPINSSSVPMLERAAQGEIAKFNSSSPIKIGQEFKSKKGITYRYVGGNRFISDNGKLLPPDTAQKVLANLSQQQSGEQGSSEGQPQGEPQDSGTDTGSTDSGTPQGEPEQGANQGSEGAPQGNDPLQGLANEIKSNPLARKIVVLLSRGDDLSLLAADILLAGQQKEAAEILKSLNTED